MREKELLNQLRHIRTLIKSNFNEAYSNFDELVGSMQHSRLELLNKDGVNVRVIDVLKNIDKNFDTEMNKIGGISKDISNSSLMVELESLIRLLEINLDKMNKVLKEEREERIAEIDEEEKRM